MKRATELIGVVVAAAEELGWTYARTEPGGHHSRIWFTKDGIERFYPVSSSPGKFKGRNLDNNRQAVKRILSQPARTP